LIIFLTFSAILVTLVFQGLTLAPLIRALGLAGASGQNIDEENEARREIIEMALRRLDKIRESEKGDFAKVFDDLELHYRDRHATLMEEESDIHSAHYRRYVELSRELLQVERRTAILLRNERRINDELLRQLEREMDLVEARLLTGKV
jgi:NhaP-type Na+/H+ or K+/H+ antiporter